MLQEMAGLGFEWVELSHGIKIVLVPGILKAVAEGVVKIASVHNFCPLPTGVTHAAPNHYMPISSTIRSLGRGVVVAITCVRPSAFLRRTANWMLYQASSR